MASDNGLRRRTTGGYDDGYRACSRFWPSHPASGLVWLNRTHDLTGLRVLDLGCGEGTNAAWLQQRSCRVTAIDVSPDAISHAREFWPDADIQWINGDITGMTFDNASYDLVIAYGILHCLAPEELDAVISMMREVTRPRGFNVMAVFNSRDQDLSGHPGFQPTLLPHAQYLHAYRNWHILRESDQDLHETHPHNNIPHHHSMTRIVARKPNE